MKCPYCNCEMVSGYLQSSRRLVWDTEKLTEFIIPGESGKYLTKGLFKAQAIRSNYCEKCNILISKLNENES